LADLLADPVVDLLAGHAAG